MPESEPVEEPGILFPVLCSGIALLGAELLPAISHSANMVEWNREIQPPFLKLVDLIIGQSHSPIAQDSGLMDLTWVHARIAFIRQPLPSTRR